MDDIVRMTDVSVKCCGRVRDAVDLLARIADPAGAEAALTTCAEIDHLESDSDRIMRSAMRELFLKGTDVRDLTRLTAIYELLEPITDKCGDIANAMKGIKGMVLDNS